MASILSCVRLPRLPQVCGGVPLAAGLALAVLAGCAGDTGQAPPATTQTLAPTPSEAETQAGEYQRIVAELRRAADCVSTTEAKPDFAPLRAKAPEGSKSTPYPTTFLDKSKATPAEQMLITNLLVEITPCQPNFGMVTVRTHQSITRMISDTWQQQSELYRHLKEGVITWGIFNQETRSNADKLSGGLQALRLTNQG